ncbi:MAG: hypothetical protein U0793_28735 [Gemmataceae bacterium]
MKVLNVAKREAGRTFKRAPRPDRRLPCQPGRQVSATVGGENVVSFWDLFKGAEVRSWDMRDAEAGSFLHSLTFTPDGKGW